MQTISTIINNNTLQSVAVLKRLAVAHRYLAELKGIVKSIPNQAIIINTLGLQEAQHSSAIENIVTTQDDLYKHYITDEPSNPATKEVVNYAEALHDLYIAQGRKKMITMNMLNKAQEIIKGNEAGIRKQKGTKLIDEQTQEVVYTPPKPDQLPLLLTDLEQFINDEQKFTDIDPLIKMAIIHHQFESIHPYYDGNGRIGRILNIIYLIQTDLLETPILYLSRYINHNKPKYYQLLQSVREQNNWEEWIIYLLDGVAKTSQNTIKLVNDIKQLQQKFKQEIRTNHAKIYSQDLLNNIFKHPYTKIIFLQNDLEVSQPTASRYLEALVEVELLQKAKIGRENYYFNDDLINLLSRNESLRVK